MKAGKGMVAATLIAATLSLTAVSVSALETPWIPLNPGTETTETAGTENETKNENGVKAKTETEKQTNAKTPQEEKKAGCGATAGSVTVAVTALGALAVCRKKKSNG